jgi:hypothetical protein
MKNLKKKEGWLKHHFGRPGVAKEEKKKNLKVLTLGLAEPPS